jgi:hypothetical protein
MELMEGDRVDNVEAEANGEVKATIHPVQDPGLFLSRRPDSVILGLLGSHFYYPWETLLTGLLALQDRRWLV